MQFVRIFMGIKENLKNILNNQRFYVNYKRMWPYVKPIWFRALCSMLICIPIGSLDAVIALALKPYMDVVMVDKSIQSPWYIPIGIVAFTSIQGGLKYLSAYLSTWVGGNITNGLKFDLPSRHRMCRIIKQPKRICTKNFFINLFGMCFVLQLLAISINCMRCFGLCVCPCCKNSKTYQGCYE